MQSLERDGAMIGEALRRGGMPTVYRLVLLVACLSFTLAAAELAAGTSSGFGRGAAAHLIRSLGVGSRGPRTKTGPDSLPRGVQHRPGERSLARRAVPGYFNASITYADGKASFLQLRVNTSSWSFSQRDAESVTGFGAAFSNLEGTVPSQLASLSELTYLDLHGNKLIGDIPPFICELSNLSYLYLSFNSLSGDIPRCLSSLSQLRVLHLRNNLLTGPFPSYVPSFSELRVADVASNRISGPIEFPLPRVSVATVPLNLTIADISTNLLTSSIPPSLCSFLNLRQLSVSSNTGLTGDVPDCLAALPKLAIFNASNTSLQGTSPSCLSASNSLTSYSVPPAVACPSDCCGYPTSSSPLCQQCPGFCSGCQPSSSLSAGAIAGIVIGVVLVVAALGALLFWLWRRRAMRKKFEAWEETLQASAFQKFSLEGIRIATKGFSKKRIVGEGAFGRVYLGDGPKGQVWAVKRSRSVARTEDELKSFETEVKGVSTLSHNHLARLYGYCCDNWEEILVFEYIPNGPLSDHLYLPDATASPTFHTTRLGLNRKGKGKVKGGRKVQGQGWKLRPTGTSGAGAGAGAGADAGQAPTGAGATVPWYTRGLPWQKGKAGKVKEAAARGVEGGLSFRERFGVAVGLAEALVYLHHGVNPPMVHRDIKPGNVLLDESFSPKLADFGLLKTLVDPVASIGTRVVGTIGYIDPEYFRSQKVTTRTDVYSYGVLLLELVTGRPANLVPPRRTPPPTPTAPASLDGASPTVSASLDAPGASGASGTPEAGGLRGPSALLDSQRTVTDVSRGGGVSVAASGDMTSEVSEELSVGGGASRGGASQGRTTAVSRGVANRGGGRGAMSMGAISYGAASGKERPVEIVLSERVRGPQESVGANVGRSVGVSEFGSVGTSETGDWRWEAGASQNAEGDVVHISSWVRPFVTAGTVADVIDPRIYDASLDSILLRVCQLALRCLGTPSRHRPDMNEVMGILQTLQREAFPQEFPPPSTSNEGFSPSPMNFSTLLIDTQSSEGLPSAQSVT